MNHPVVRILYVQLTSTIPVQMTTPLPSTIVMIFPESDIPVTGSPSGYRTAPLVGHATMRLGSIVSMIIGLTIVPVLQLL